MRITWINPAAIVERDGQKTSVRACVRLRSMIPGDELARQGHDVLRLSLGELEQAAAGADFLKRDAFVIGKAFADLSSLMKSIHAATDARVIVDVCDNVFEPPEDGLKHVYQAILPQADAIVTSSDLLREALIGKVPSGTPSFVVADAVEGAPMAPSFDPLPGRVRLLWFGYPNNLPLLRLELANLGTLAAEVAVELAIVSAWSRAEARAMFPDVQHGIRMRRVEWSPEAMRDELHACDFVIVPSDDGLARRTKSANRVITGLWAGKFVVAYPLPSYEPFRDFARVGRDLVAGIRWAIEHRERIPERVERGQQFIREHYSPEIVARTWEAVLRSVLGSRSRRTAG